MKKYILVASLFSYVLLHSCQKEGQINSALKVAPNKSFSVSDAKNRFYQVAINAWTGFRSRPNSKLKSFTPNWNRAVTGEDKENEVVEIPLRFETLTGFTTGANQPVGGKTSLVILKNKSTHNLRIVLMHVLNNSAPGVDAKYLGCGKDFNGEIFFTDLYGEFINGWIYKNGKVIAGSKELNTRKSVARAPLPGNCETRELKWYERTCTFYNDNSVECTSWQYVGSTYQTYCTDESSGGVSPSSDCNIPSGQEFLSQSGPISESVSSTSGPQKISSNGEITKEWHASWKFYTGTFFNYTWKYISFEKGVHVKINNVWKWKSLTHISHAQEGASPFTTTCTLITATPSISANLTTARMELDYEVKMCLQCRGWTLGCFPEIAYSAKSWTIAPNGTVYG